MKIKKIIKTGLGALMLSACSSSPDWNEPPIFQPNQPTPQIEQAAPKPEEKKPIILEVPITYTFDKPSTRSAFEGFIKEALEIYAKSDEIKNLDAEAKKKKIEAEKQGLILTAASCIGGNDGVITEQELIDYCKRNNSQPPYIKAEGDVGFVGQLDLSKMDALDRMKLLAFYSELLRGKPEPKPAEIKPAGPVEKKYSTGVTFESELIRAYANGFMNTHMKIKEIAPDAPNNAEMRMKEYRSIAGEDGQISREDLEKALNLYQAATGNTIKPQYEGLDAEKIEIAVTMPSEQASRLDELIKKYKPDETTVVFAVKKHSTEQEGKKVRNMTDKDVDAIAAEWQEAYK